MIIDNIYEIGDIVYLKTDKEQLQRMVTGILVSPTGLSYRCANGTADTWQFGIEIDKEKNIMYATTN